MQIFFIKEKPGLTVPYSMTSAIWDGEGLHKESTG